MYKIAVAKTTDEDFVSGYLTLSRGMIVVGTSFDVPHSFSTSAKAEAELEYWYRFGWNGIIEEAKTTGCTKT